MTVVITDIFKNATYVLLLTAVFGTHNANGYYGYSLKDNPTPKVVCNVSIVNQDGKREFISPNYNNLNDCVTKSLNNIDKKPTINYRDKTNYPSVNYSFDVIGFIPNNRPYLNSCFVYVKEKENVWSFKKLIGFNYPEDFQGCISFFTKLKETFGYYIQLIDYNDRNGSFLLKYQPP